MVYGSWFMVYGLWFMVYGLWFRVWGLGVYAHPLRSGVEAVREIEPPQAFNPKLQTRNPQP